MTTTHRPHHDTAAHDGTRALAVLVVLLGVGCQRVGIRGRRTLSLLSESKELQMGLSAYQEILEKSKVSTDRAPVD